MRLIRRPRWLLPSVPIKLRQKLPEECGVYYVMKGTSILYIGRSKNINMRWNSATRPHHKLGVFYSDPLVRIHYQILPSRLVNDWEAAEILRYRPNHNAKIEPISNSLAWKIYEFQCMILDGFFIALAMLAVTFGLGWRP
jgi:excinuclease UvrABC nuclease subunit